jgi:hypothetical protein
MLPTIRVPGRVSRRHASPYLRQHKDTSEISVSSQESLRGSCYPTAENRTRNLLVDVVERIHRAFHPSLVYLQIDILVSTPSRTDSPSQVVMAMKHSHLCHESSDGILSLRRAGIVRDQSALPRRRRARRRRRSKVGVRSRKRVGVHQQHELDIAAGEEGVDVVVLERVDFLEISSLGVN